MDHRLDFLDGIVSTIDGFDGGGGGDEDSKRKERVECVKRLGKVVVRFINKYLLKLILRAVYKRMRSNSFHNDDDDDDDSDSLGHDTVN